MCIICICAHVCTYYMCFFFVSLSCYCGKETGTYISDIYNRGWEISVLKRLPINYTWLFSVSINWQWWHLKGSTHSLIVLAGYDKNGRKKNGKIGIVWRHGFLLWKHWKFLERRIVHTSLSYSSEQWWFEMEPSLGWEYSSIALNWCGALYC